MQKITPHLWFDTEAKTAAEFYVAAFGRESEVLSTNVLDGTPSGSVDVVNFSLWGFRFDAISAGPFFKFNPSISISVQCHDEAEIDRLYAVLKEGGKELMELSVYPWSKKYGWVNDAYGLSWQLNLPADNHDYKDRICPFLMFTKEKAGKAQEAMNFYASVFPDSKVRFVARYEQGEPSPEGAVKHGEFELFGQTMMALDGYGPHEFVFNEAVSLLVCCKDQAEIDRYWNALSAVPEAEQCGWLRDKFGVSWQIVPEAMEEMMRTGDREKIARVTQAFLKMKKLDVAALQSAYDNA